MTIRGLTVTALAVATITSSSLAAEQVPSCELFKQRFAEAPSVLSLRLPSRKFHREEDFHGHQAWKTDAIRAPDGELWFTTGVYCDGDKLNGAVTDLDSPFAAQHPTFELVAAGVYAATGWDAKKVFKTTEALIKKRPTGMGNVQSSDLIPKTIYWNFDFMGYSIDVEGAR